METIGRVVLRPGFEGCRCFFGTGQAANVAVGRTAQGQSADMII